jgi:hypothetical protein
MRATSCKNYVMHPLRREFRVYAAERDIDMSALFADMWTFYKEHHG